MRPFALRWRRLAPFQRPRRYAAKSIALHHVPGTSCTEIAFDFAAVESDVKKRILGTSLYCKDGCCAASGLIKMDIDIPNLVHTPLALRDVRY
eukprot:3116360-Rhodomonas_salina.1